MANNSSRIRMISLTDTGCVLLDHRCCRSAREQYDEGAVQSDGKGRTAGRRVSKSAESAGDTNA